MLPYGRQSIEDDDIAAVTAALRGDRLTGGPHVPAFENAFAQATGAARAVACANGTAALHLAMMALGVGPGDAVIVPSITFVATANAVRLVGGEVVFCDVDPETGLITPETLSAALAAVPAGLRVRAAVIVHLNGQAAPLAALADIARTHGLALVADSCHALGTQYIESDGTQCPIGAARYADLETFSFHSVKTIAMGEGGAVTTGNTMLADRIVRLRNHGLTRSPEAFTESEQAFDTTGRAHPWYYEMAEIGLNYRASDLQCALGQSQLAKLDRFAHQRKALAERYDSALAGLDAPVSPPQRQAHDDPVWHLYAVRIDFGTLDLDRDTVMRRLYESGVATQVHYIPVHRQPYYRERYGRQTLPGADRYYARCLSLPLFPAMTETDVDQVVAALGKALRGPDR